MDILHLCAAFSSLIALLATAAASHGNGTINESSRGLLARDSRRLRPIQKTYFTISPTTGSPTGGTQVVAYLGDAMMDTLINPYRIRCAFGDKAMPAQSYFQDPDSITPSVAVLCEAPAGPAKNSVVVRLSLDGSKYFVGPMFTYKTEKSTTTAKDTV